MILLHAPHLQVARRRHQRSVVVVHRVAQRVVVAVDLAARLQQLHLVAEATLREHPHRLLGRRLMAAEGHVHVHNLLHPRPDLLHILVGERLAAALAHVAVVAQRQRMLNKQLAARQHIGRGLVEHKAQRTHIHAVTRAAASVHKLHIAVLEQPELQALRGVIHFCRHHRILKIELVGKLLVHIEQRSAFGEALRHIVVLASDLKHRCLSLY